MLDAIHLRYPELHWWHQHTATSQARVIAPRIGAGEPVNSGQRAWETVLQQGRGDHTTAVMEPLIDGRNSKGPQQVALELASHNGVVVGFDVWWLSRKKDGGPSKGFLPVPSFAFFYHHVLVQVPASARHFYQLLRPDRACAFYFDADADDPAYDMVAFVQALFEAMAAELQARGRSDMTPEWLWQNTILLDGGCNASGTRLKGSCHGITPLLVFADNHTDMKRFAQAVHHRLQARQDLYTWKTTKTKHERVLPFDVSVYAHHRHFRFHQACKMTPPTEMHKQRPLQLASYNRCQDAESLRHNDEALFMYCVIPQPALAPRVMPTDAAIATVRPVMKRARIATTDVAASASTPLEHHLLKRLAAWGNASARISSVARARHMDDALYVSFANATHAHDHRHRSNNVHAVVSFHRLEIQWRCHKGTGPRCPPHTEPLPLGLALEQ